MLKYFVAPITETVSRNVFWYKRGIRIRDAEWSGFILALSINTSKWLFEHYGIILRRRGRSVRTAADLSYVKCVWLMARWSARTLASRCLNVRARRAAWNEQAGPTNPARHPILCRPAQSRRPCREHRGARVIPWLFADQHHESNWPG